MKISIRKDSPDYTPDAKYCDVFLDGVRLAGVIEADEEAGEVWMVDYSLPAPERGKPITVTKVRRGHVEIHRMVHDKADVRADD